ncbi:hypothetical protein BJ875DRAFT_456540 [Amylocarpus encephaloides]|uniref:Uncharacterized protein n=1 Tax=Amylocarpus encephaloides TaxID=45428 RepID=A0A9P7YMN1_9HELO|nr:hypothetical protein BJ875DRAFT_456540 [Amylocarpus encephaloides]
MNWTGGRLQRHSNASDTAKHRQQQHFAKVKTNLLAGKKRSPPKHPNLDRIREHYEGPSRCTTRDSPPLEQSSRNVETQCFAQRSLQTSSRVVVGSRSAHEHTAHQEYSPASGNFRMVDVAIHDSARSADAKKRERERDSSVTGSEDGNDIDELDSLAQKRRKILLTGDWVSVGFQRAPRLKYVPPRQDDQIGRRRKVSDGHRAQYSGKLRSKILSPVASRDQPLPVEGLEQKASRKSRPTDVKISVGNKVILPGISSSAQSQRYSNGSAQPQSLRPQTESLDIMLLDNESRCMNSLQSLGPPSTIGSKNRGMSTPQPQFRSSSASLQHPKPQSSKVASILRSDSSDIVQSTLAQVGRPKPVVTSSQVMDNKIWETWMTAFNLPEDALSGGIASQEDNMQEQIEMISPGVSAAPTHPMAENNENGSPTHNDCGSLEELLHSDLGNSLELGLGSYAASDRVNDYTADIDKLQSSPPQESSFQSSPSASSILPQSNFKDLSPIPDLACDDESQASQSQPSSPSNRSSDHIGSSTSPLERQKNLQSFGRLVPKDETITPVLSLPEPKQSIEPQENSADEAWRQFVFGSDSEEVDIFHRHAAAELAHEPAYSEESYLVPQEFLDQSIGYSVAMNFSKPDHQHSTSDHGSQISGRNFSDATKGITEPAPSTSYTARYSTEANATHSYESDTSRQYSNYPLPSSSSNLAPASIALRGSRITTMDQPSQIRPKRG